MEKNEAVWFFPRTRYLVLREIREKPERHLHRTLKDLLHCSFVEGHFDFMVCQAHEDILQVRPHKKIIETK